MKLSSFANCLLNLLSSINKSKWLYNPSVNKMADQPEKVAKFSKKAANIEKRM